MDQYKIVNKKRRGIDIKKRISHRPIPELLTSQKNSYDVGTHFTYIWEDHMCVLPTRTFCTDTHFVHISPTSDKTTCVSQPDPSVLIVTFCTQSLAHISPTSDKTPCVSQPDPTVLIVTFWDSLDITVLTIK